MDQKTLFYRTHAQIADGNEAFMDLVREGMTREELARCIERRPSHWKRFEGFLDVLPSGGKPPKSNFRVSLHEEPDDGFAIHFDCFADNAEHAYEQAESAYTGAELLVASPLN